MKQKHCALFLLMIFATSSLVLAGTYRDTVDFSYLPTNDPNYVPPFAIVHPFGYDGSGGVYDLSVCVPTGSEALIGPVQFAIEKWNALTPATGNCWKCVLAEETTPPGGQPHAVVATIHELGHCAMGLDHINLVETDRQPTSTSTGTCDVDSNNLCQEVTSFTASVNASEVFHNAQMPRGVKEDDHVNQCPTSGSLHPPAQQESSSLSGDLLAEQELACLLGNACPVPAECCPNPPPAVPIQVQDISWYRIADNNPVIVDATEIDKDTFSRSTTNLPAGSSYAASANRGVAEALGAPRTQSVMYSATTREVRYLDLSADEVNMVKMGTTGADRDATQMPDDNYTITLTFAPDCSGADYSSRALR